MAVVESAQRTPVNSHSNSHSKGTNMTTNIPNAIAYKGDDDTKIVDKVTNRILAIGQFELDTVTTRWPADGVSSPFCGQALEPKGI